MKIDLNDLLKAAEPEVGKKFCNLLLEYIEKCKTDRSQRLIENIIRNKLDSEMKKSFFRVIKRLVKAIF